jgi:hypothetical protein
MEFLSHINVMSTTNLYYAQGQTDDGYKYRAAAVKRNCGTPACGQQPQYYPQPPPPAYPYYPQQYPQQQTHVDMVPVVHHTGHQQVPYYHQHLPIIIDASEPTPAPTTTSPPQKNGIIVTGPGGNPYVVQPVDPNSEYAVTLPWTLDTTPPPTTAPPGTTAPPETTAPPNNSVTIDRNTLNQVLSVVCIFFLIMLLWTVMGAGRY